MAIDTPRYAVRLTEMLTELTNELKTIGVHNPQNPQDWIAVPEGTDANEPDSDLVADSFEEGEERQALVASLEHQYNDIVRALKKIDDGVFGSCEICSALIEEDRLDANPTARTDKAHMEEESTLP